MPAETKVRVELDKAQLDALTGKFERLGALVNEVNSILKELSQNEIAVSLTIDGAD